MAGCLVRHFLMSCMVQGLGEVMIESVGGTIDTDIEPVLQAATHLSGYTQSTV